MIAYAPGKMYITARGGERGGIYVPFDWLKARTPHAWCPSLMSSDEKKLLSRVGGFIKPVVLGTVMLVIGFFLRSYLSKWTAPKRTVSVVSEDSRNFILPQQALFGVRSMFTILSNPSAVIKSYFVYMITVTNDGGEPLSGGELFMECPPDITLIKSPLIKTEPPGLRDAMHLSREPTTSQPNLDVWHLGLLNPGEKIRFMYGGYSLTEIDTSHIRVIFRKKDWSAFYSYVTPGELSLLRAKIDSLAMAERHINLLYYLVIVLLVIDLGITVIRLFKPPAKQE